MFSSTFTRKWQVEKGGHVIRPFVSPHLTSRGSTVGFAVLPWVLQRELDVLSHGLFFLGGGRGLCDWLIGTLLAGWSV